MLHQHRHLHHTPRGEEYVNIELAPLLDATGQQAYYVERMAPLNVAHGKPLAQGLIGRAPIFQAMLALVARVAPSMATVLLQGELGTGKELVAQAIHTASERAHRPLVVVDCASMPENLFESELFGHERGAFTGANAARAGLVEAASGGTLFLDEVGDIPLTIQVKLLRLLESGTYRRVGSTEIRHADIRVVSATHRDLVSMVSLGTFREDLYYRLSTFPICLPPLRERIEDIPLLSDALLQRLYPKRKLKLSSSAENVLQSQLFSGNVRELRNILERSAILCDGDTLEATHLMQAFKNGGKQVLHKTEPAQTVNNKVVSATPLKAAEHEAFVRLVQQHRGDRAELAKQLGISTRSLYRKLKTINSLSMPAPD